MAITVYLSIITLSRNGLNAPIKDTGSLNRFFKNQRPTHHMLPTVNPFQIERHTKTENKGVEKDISCKFKQKK